MVRLTKNVLIYIYFTKQLLCFCSNNWLNCLLLGIDIHLKCYVLMFQCFGKFKISSLVLIISRALSAPIVIASQDLIGSSVVGFGPADFLHIIEGSRTASKRERADNNSWWWTNRANLKWTAQKMCKGLAALPQTCLER